MKQEPAQQGLSEKEAKRRLVKFGPNTFKKKRESSDLKTLLDQFKSPLIYILVFAGLVTLILKEFVDATVIFAAVFLNTILGFFQERKAQQALKALRSYLVAQAKVIRGGKREMIDARQVVPGDLVILEIGVRVPADGVLIEATDLSLNEAILTGESMPVKKKRNGKVFMGTTVTTGIAKMVVGQTGMRTEMGKIGETVTELEEEKTPLQLQLNKLAKVLAIVVGIVALFIFLFGELMGQEPLEMFTVSVAIAVAAIPEGLVVTLTVILSLGMQRILRRRALVRKLLAAETLGSVNVICCDKTGTLTEGEMKVVGAATPDEKRLIEAAIVCNDLRDPLETAMMAWAKKKTKNTKKIEAKYPRVDEIPFSPDYKYIATLHPGVLFLSGAPEVILDRCQASQLEKAKIKKEFADYGQEGYRLVGFAWKKLKRGEDKNLGREKIRGFQWLGILLFEDPVRMTVARALKECQRAGIKVKVITGDYRQTAEAVLRKLKLLKEIDDAEVIVGEELARIPKKELEERIEEVVLFARVDPHQKLKIVEALQNKGEVVAMMGDGVNDAPALKKADIGIVVNEASDVAKETADIVLLDSRFDTIVASVEEGRAIFENIKKVVLYLLSDSFTEVILVAGSLLLGLPLPLTAAQILWVNLVEDGLPGIALAFDPKEKDLMRESPRPKKTPILDTEMKVLIFIIGLFTDLVLLTLLYFLSRGLFHLHYIQTIIFAALAIDSLIYVFSCRSLKTTIFHEHPFENKVLNGSVIISLLLLLGGIYLPFLQTLLKTHPLGWPEWLLIMAIGIFEILAIETTKWAFIVKRRKV